MGVNIVITSGPTNEPIDAVMKVTNMSTGTLGSLIAETFLSNRSDNIDRVYYISPKLARKPCVNSDKLELISIESTQDLLDVLTHILTTEHIGVVIHSAAVGDYKSRHTIRAEDLIDELLEEVPQMVQKGEFNRESIMSIFENPKIVQNDTTKISSYEEHLMTIFTLTPKVIGSIKRLSPDARLVGFKLLEGVSRDELLQVASKLQKKNGAEFIVANDLSKIGGGKHWAMIVGKDGIVTECQTKDEIAVTLEQLLFQ